jgi:hypothetical protein
MNDDVLVFILSGAFLGLVFLLAAYEVSRKKTKKLVARPLPAGTTQQVPPATPAVKRVVRRVLVFDTRGVPILETRVPRPRGTITTRKF